MAKEKLDPEKLKQLKKEHVESLCMDRYNLLMAFPFIGNILMRMELLPTRDLRIRTAATNGSKIYFDMAFYDSLRNEERTFVLAHEVFHCVLLHLTRQNSRDHDIWNMAIDMEVNHMLRNQQSVVSSGKASCFNPPSFVLFPPKNLEGKAAEVIFEYLVKQKKNGNLSQTLNECAGKKTKDSDSSSSPFSINGDGEENIGSKSGKLKNQFDNHIFEPDDSSSTGTPTITDKWGEVGFDDDVDTTVSKDFAEKMREAILAEVQRAKRTQGSIPVGIESILDKIMKPEIKWQEVLAQFVTSCYNGKRRWLPPSRRHVYNETYLQSRRNETINIIVAIDTSGSCIGDLPKFFGELNGLVNSFGSYTMHMIQCDATVTKYDLYDDNTPFDVDETNKIEWAGGGGTSFTPVFKFVEKEGITADCLIYLTDSYGDVPEQAPNYPVLWLLTKDANINFCKWGRKIKFKQSSYDY